MHMLATRRHDAIHAAQGQTTAEHPSDLAPPLKRLVSPWQRVSALSAKRERVVVSTKH